MVNVTYGLERAFPQSRLCPNFRHNSCVMVIRMLPGLQVQQPICMEIFPLMNRSVKGVETEGVGTDMGTDVCSVSDNGSGEAEYENATAHA